MLNLERIFKSDIKPEITAVVVRDSKISAISEGVKQAISTAGFAVDKITKSDDGVTLVYNQVDKQPEGTQLIRLNDDVVLVVKGGFGNIPTDGSFGKMVIADGFYSGVDVALGTLQESMGKVITTGTDSKKMASDIGEVIDEFKAYSMALVGTLPLNAFKADIAILEAIKKADVVKKADAANTMADIPCDTCGKKGCPGCKGSKKEAAAEAINNVTDKLGNLPCDQCGKKSCPGCMGSDKEKASMAVDTITKFEVTKVDSTTLNGLDALLAQAPKHIAENDWGKMSTIDKITWLKNWQEGDPKAAGPGYGGASKGSPNPTPLPGTPSAGGSLADSQFTQPLDLGLKADKSDMEKLTNLVQSIATKVDGLGTSTASELNKLATKVDAIVTTQGAQQKVVDDLVTKAETLTNKLGTTVAAAPKSEDVPTQSISLVSSRVQKSDDEDPRTGCFDTAFITRKRGERVARR